MILQDNDDRFMVFAAFRYALGRMSTASTILTGKLKELWPNLYREEQQQIQREIKEAIHFDRAGMICDIELWQEIAALPLREEL